MQDPTESKQFLHGSGVNDVDYDLYIAYTCPACGAQLEGQVVVTVNDSDVGTFNIDCPSCDGKDLLIERTFTVEDLFGPHHTIDRSGRWDGHEGRKRRKHG